VKNLQKSEKGKSNRFRLMGFEATEFFCLVVHVVLPQNEILWKKILDKNIIRYTKKRNTLFIIES